jgi:rare lipoprotein A
MRYRHIIACGILWVSWHLGHAQVQKGVASYYSDAWRGRRTSSGERYNPDSLTCAHRTLPFGTLLKVYCPSKGTTVVVRVNDRGPFGKGRIVDLSGAAARKLDIIRAGVAEVEVEIVYPEPPVPIFPAQAVPEPMARRTIASLRLSGPPPTMAIPQPPRPPVSPEETGRKGKRTHKVGSK